MNEGPSGATGGLSASAPSVLERITSMLDLAGAAYRLVHHEPTRTSEDSARVRGEPLRVGGKALLVRVDDAFRLFVLSAALKFDSASAKRRFAARSIRFATADELTALTGLVPGAVPPFGEPILPFPLYVDPSVLENDRVAFNAGSLTDSIIMPLDDYRRAARPEVFPFSRPA